MAYMQRHVTAERPEPAARAVDNGQEPDLGTDAVTISVKLCNLPPLNSIASQVLALTADPDVDLRRIASVIEADPAFAADVLFLANSSLFGFPSRMYILRHAIAVLGIDRIKALAVTVAMRGFLGNGTPLIHQCWVHSAACACICEEIAAIYDVSGDRAYTAGIMHDIGRLGLLKTYPKDLTPVLKREHEDVGAVLQAEREVLNVDHGRAGAWLLKAWALPPSLAEICRHHHDPPADSDEETLHLVKAACRIADALGFSAVTCRYRPSYFEAVSGIGARLKTKAIPMEEEMRANVAARLAAFGS